MKKLFLKKKAVINEKICVACGCCVKVCPLSAIKICNGITAKINVDKCVGCGKCISECPASIISLKELAK